MKLHKVFEEMMDEVAKISGHQNNTVTVLLTPNVLQKFSEHFRPIQTELSDEFRGNVEMKISSYYTKNGIVSVKEVVNGKI